MKKRLLIIILLIILCVLFSGVIIEKNNYKNEARIYLNEKYNMDVSKVKLKVIRPTIKDKILDWLPKDEKTGYLIKLDASYENVDFNLYKNSTSYGLFGTSWSDNYQEGKESNDESERIGKLLYKYSDIFYVKYLDNGNETGYRNYNLFILNNSRNTIENLFTDLEEDLDVGEKRYIYTLYLVNDSNLVINAQNNSKLALDGMAEKYKEEEFDNFASTDKDIIYRCYKLYNGEYEWSKISIVK